MQGSSKWLALLGAVLIGPAAWADTIPIRDHGTIWDGPQNRESCEMELTVLEAETYTDHVKNSPGPAEIPDPPYYIPIAPHIVRKADGSGGLPEWQYEVALADLNGHFAANQMIFYTSGPIDYIDSDAYYYDVDTMPEIDDLRTQNMVPGAINIYFTAGNFPYCGISAFSFSAVQSIIMHNNCTATPGTYGNHSTFSHEVGHFFDLFHTHEPAFGVEFVNGTNCSSTGDLVCDTPADPSLSGLVDLNCDYTGTGTDPNGAPYAPDPDQLMSYSSKHCRTGFSPQTLARALNTLFTERDTLVTFPLSAAEGEGGTPSAIALAAPWPNPSRGVSEMSFAIPAGGHVNVTVYDIRGAQVRTIADRWYDPGEYAVGWDGRDAAGTDAAVGIYFAQMQTAGEVRTQKILRR